MKITIITATYNSGSTLRDTIESVLSQTYKDIEYLIIDGVSKDNTLDIAREYESRFEGKMRIISEPDKGIYDALNKGVRYATGEVIGFVHADDMLADGDVLQQIVNCFNETQCHIAYGDLSMISSTDNYIVRKWISSDYKAKKLKMGWMPAHPTMYAKKEVYSTYGLYDTAFKISADYDFILRAFSKLDSTLISYIPYTLVKMRVGGVSTKVSNLVKVIKEDWYAIRKNEIGGLSTLLLKKVSKLSQFKRQ